MSQPSGLLDGILAALELVGAGALPVSPVTGGRRLVGVATLLWATGVVVAVWCCANGVNGAGTEEQNENDLVGDWCCANGVDGAGARGETRAEADSHI